MRATLFIIATVLSSFGMLQNFVAISVIGEDNNMAGIAFLCTSLYAWFSYFVMGMAWIRNEPAALLWPISGTLAGLLALNGGGSFFLSDHYSPAVMLIPAAFVSPAIIMSLWLVIYHLGAQQQHRTA